MKKLIIGNVLYWLMIQMIISTLGTFVTNAFLERHLKYFRIWPIEQNGALWQKYFKVKRWKRYLPDGQRINPNIYSKSKFDKSITSEALHQFIIETRRAELVHILSIVPVVIFLRATKMIKVINVIYVLLANVPCMIAQRYNRPKLERYYLAKVNRKGD